MRLFLIVIGLVVTLPALAASIIFENATEGDDGIIPLASGSDMDFDLAGESGEGSLVALTDDNDLACLGDGLETAPGTGRSLIQVDITTGGSLLYYVDGEFTYDAISKDMKVSAPGLDVACIGSVILNDGFEE